MVKIKHILKAQSAETYLLKAFGMNLSEDIKGLNVIRNELPSAALGHPPQLIEANKKAAEHLQWALDQTLSILRVRVFCVLYLRSAE